MLVIFSIGQGDFQAQGFPVSLWIATRDGDPPQRFEGHLPAAPNIPELLTIWQDSYQRYPYASPFNLRIESVASQITNFSALGEVRSRANDLTIAMQRWLRQNPDSHQDSFRELQHRAQKLLLTNHAPVRVIIETSDQVLRQLPWHLPQLWDTSPAGLEIVFGAASVSSPLPLRYPIKILAILGSNNGINTQIDRDILSELEKNYPVEIDWLPKAPSGTAVERGDLARKLRENTYDIIYFGGHSRSQDEVGEIYINDNESLQMQDLYFALRKAVSKGLQLVIFNSCQGLGLAHNLEKLGVPHIIAMREAIPDQAAHRFLQDFIEAFTQAGLTLSDSVKEAREQLEDIQDQCPCATFLPILIQDPIAPDLQWPVAPVPLPQHWWQRWVKPAVAMILMLGLVFLGLFVWPWPHIALGQRMSMGEKVLIKSHQNTTDKESGAQAFKSEQYEKAQEYFENARSRAKADPEALIYLNNSQVALDRIQDPQRKIVRFVASIPIGNDPSGEQESRTGNLDVAQEILRGIAQGQDEWNKKYKNDKDQPILEIMIANDENKPKIVQKLAKAISNNSRIYAVIGSNTSDTSLAAAPIYQKEGLVMLTPTSFAARLTDIDEDILEAGGTYVFKMTPDLGFYAEQLAEYTAAEVNKPRVCICEDPEAADIESFKKRFVFELYNSKIGGKVINVTCILNTQDFPPQVIDKFHKNEANVILLVPHIGDIDRALGVAKVNHEKKPNLFLLSSPTMNTEETLSFGQQNVEGLTMVVPWFQSDSDDKTTSVAVAEEAKVLWGGRVNWRWAEAYDATLTLMEAFRNARPSNREDLRNALIDGSFKYSGVTGEVKFLPGGDRQPTDNGTLIQVQPVKGSPYGYDFVALPNPDKK